MTPIEDIYVSTPSPAQSGGDEYPERRKESVFDPAIRPSLGKASTYIRKSNFTINPPLITNESQLVNVRSRIEVVSLEIDEREGDIRNAFDFFWTPS